MTTTTKADEGQISLVRIQRSTIRIHILGITPFIPNKFGEKAREEMRIKRFTDEGQQAKSPRKARNPEQEYEAQERQTMVLEMLQTLPEDQRAALLLREQEQLSYREIGQVLNVSESKVKVDIFRARASLRERWSKVSGLSRVAGTSH